MSIEWGGLNLQSTTTCQVLDPGQQPTNVLKASDPFAVRINWNVPAGLAPFLGGSFRVRCFVESIGPGQEKPIGAPVTYFEPVVPGQLNYTGLMNVPANELQGEGEIDAATGMPVSGIYKIGTVIQHVNGVATQGCGFAEAALIQIRRP